MFKSVVYQGNCLLGEAEIYPQNPSNATWNKEIRISHFSQTSDRCPPLAVLHTIATTGVSFRMESKSQEDLPLFLLHATCLRENKTAIVLQGEMEIHLVAMASRKNLAKYSCFWGFTVAAGLYSSCVTMLNLRCLGIVFDLDETLIVANTMRSFEDRIDALQRKINSESDPQRVAGMLSEIKRYQDDKSILKQYVDNDQVVESGQVFKVQSEIVPSHSDGQQPIIRPLIRLQDKNIILTRVNPGIRDTSVLVRLRPGWEDLRSYLTARGRKRFEVYVCTMAERDYALEMWRLLDPEANLIHTSQLSDRIVCVKSGLRKSLVSVFQNIICHPRMALVIDDRLKVWDDKDQARVHVVPAFAPYYAPLAEANSAVPVLCVARNVACNVRGSFFKEFDEGLLPRISVIAYEDSMTDFPSAPDVGNYLISEDDSSVLNGNKDPLCFEGITDVEVERKLLKDGYNAQAIPLVTKKFDPRPAPSLPQVLVSSSSMVSQMAPTAITPLHNNPYSQIPESIAPVKTMVRFGFSEPSLQSSPAREEGEVPESELDPDTRRRLLILQHGQDTRDHASTDPLVPARAPIPVPLPTLQSHGRWHPMDEDVSPRKLNRTPKEYPLESESLHFDKKRPYHPPFFRGMESSSCDDRGFQEHRRFPKKVQRGDHRYGVDHSSLENHESFPGEEMPAHLSSNSKDTPLEPGRVRTQYSETPVGVLEEIAIKCGAKVEFRAALVDTTDLNFTVEVLFVGEKLGEGIGKTRKEAQRQAAECSIRTLASKNLLTAVRYLKLMICLLRIWQADYYINISSFLIPLYVLCHILFPSSFEINSADRYLSDAVPEFNTMHGDPNKVSHDNDNGFVNDSPSFVYPTIQKSSSLANVSTTEQSHFVDGRYPSNTSLYALNELCIVEGFDLVFQPRPSFSTDPLNEGQVHLQVEIDGQIFGKGTGMSWEDAKLQASEEALANLRSTLVHFSQKHSPSTRSFQTAPTKRLKADSSRGLPRTFSSRYSKNETFVP